MTRPVSNPGPRWECVYCSAPFSDAKGDRCCTHMTGPVHCREEQPHRFRPPPPRPPRGRDEHPHVLDRLKKGDAVLVILAQMCRRAWYGVIHTPVVWRGGVLISISGN